jgi:lysophospholipase L1-like esterase
MRFTYFFLSFLFLFSGCSQKAKEATLPITIDTSSNSNLRYLALGDSYTIGERVAIEDRFPHQLVSKLKYNDFSINFPVYVAQTGWTTNDLMAGIEAADLTGTFDLVSLLIGANNQFSGMTIEEYESGFESLLEKAIEFAGGDHSKVFIVSIPDYAYSIYGQSFPSPETISMEIDEYNVINKAIAAAYDIQYFDITPISREGLDIPELISQDNLHPSEEQYRRWVNLMYNGVLRMLEE